ncbi:MAG: CpsD/CapB family tyrosine-protein kinase [Clostridiaceae bacterium]
MKIMSRLITYLQPKSPISEAYRTLRTNIQFSSIDRKIKVIAITSSELSEGKSTILSNLAVTIAQSGKKVLILDCDLRKPSIHKIFRITNNIGFINVLSENLDVTDVITNIKEVDGLSVLTSGIIPPNPSEVLDSKKAKDLIEELKESFDIILIDTPPVSVVTDASILSSYVDGVIIIASYGETDINVARETKLVLDKVNAPFLGVVLNKVPVSKRNFLGGYYYRYHKYYGD